LHAVATTTVAGFLSAADKTRLDGLVATTAPSQITIATAAPGSNANVAARIDHIHSVSTGTPVALTLGGANAPGNATSLAPSNHVHALPASNVAPAALTVGATGAPGSSAAISNAGHVHAMPGVATVLTDGFMIWSDKLTLDGLIGNPNPGINGFRLAPTSDDSIPADGIYNNLYLVAVDGDCIGLYDVVAGGWRQCRVTPFSQAVSGRTGGRPFDVFLALSFPAPIDGTASSVVMEFVDWSSTNTRATGLTRVKGVWTKAGDQTRRYLGTVLPSSAVAYQWILQGGGTTSANMPIWNAANRRLVTLRYQPAYDTYKIPESAVVYRWGNVTQAQIGIVRGDSLEPVNLQASCSVFPNSAEVSVGIGIDNLAMVGGRTFAKTTNDANAVVTIQAQYAAYLSGYRAYIPLMVTGYQESTFYGNHASPGGTVSISTLYATTTQ
jgi:hypothetical protein